MKLHTNAIPFFLCLIVLLPLSISGQNLTHRPYLSSSIFDITWNYKKHRSIGVYDGISDASSTAITPALTNAYLANEFIDNDLKDEVLAKLKVENWYGQDLDNSFTFAHYIDSLFSGSGIFYLSVKNRVHTDINFTDDFFKLVFYGNGYLAGSEAKLTGSSLHRIRYNQYQLGLKWLNQVENKSYEFGGAISFLQTITHVHVDIPEMTIFTQIDGEFIDVSLDFKMRISDTTSKRLTDVNGVGASADLFFGYTVEDKFTINFSVSDIGFLTMNDKALEITKDTTFRFDGWDAVDIFNLEDNFFAQANRDSLFNSVNFNFEHKNYLALLPMKFLLTFDKTLQGDKLHLVGGFYYRLTANFRPMIFVKSYYEIMPSFYVSLFTGYGGYTAFQLGLELSKSFKDRVYVNLGSNSLQGFIFPHNATASSVFARLGIAF